MQPVVTADEMRALDRATIEDIGLPALTLMETAGRGVADVAIRMLGAHRGPVAVVCGPGNNGGDGFVVTRVLRDRGLDAIVYLAVGREAIKGDALAHLAILERAGGVVQSIATPAELAEVDDAISSAALVVDALFGLGPLRAIEGHLANVIAQINAARLRRLRSVRHRGHRSPCRPDRSQIARTRRGGERLTRHRQPRATRPS